MGAQRAEGREFKVTSVALPRRDIVALRELAREQERTLSAEVRRAISKHLADQGHAPEGGAV